jgi:hypothetical protein
MPLDQWEIQKENQRQIDPRQLVMSGHALPVINPQSLSKFCPRFWAPADEINQRIKLIWNNFLFCSIFLTLLGSQQFLEDLRFQLAVGKLYAQLELEIVVNVTTVQHLDLFNQALRPEAQGGAGDTVGVGQAF